MPAALRVFHPAKAVAAFGESVRTGGLQGPAQPRRQFRFEPCRAPVIQCVFEAGVFTDGAVAKIALDCHDLLGHGQHLLRQAEAYHFAEDQGLPLRAHNGHGKQHLSSLPASLIVLAFLTHTVLEWMDGKYRLLRKKLPSRKRLFNDIRTLTSYLCFESWEALMDFMLKSFEPPPPTPKSG